MDTRLKLALGGAALIAVIAVIVSVSLYLTPADKATKNKRV